LARALHFQSASLEKKETEDYKREKVMKNLTNESELRNEQLDAVSGGSIAIVMEGSSSLWQALEAAADFIVNCKIDGNPCTPSPGMLGGGK
jgi:hypothetical protein